MLATLLVTGRSLDFRHEKRTKLACAQPLNTDAKAAKPT